MLHPADVSPPPWPGCAAARSQPVRLPPLPPPCAGSLDGKGGQPGARVAKAQLGSVDGSPGPLLDAVLVGADRGRDLAVLRLERPPPGLAPLPRGSSADVRPGQLALALGSPFGFGGTLAAGVVSAVGRGFQSMTGSVIPGGIQTDAGAGPAPAAAGGCGGHACQRVCSDPA